MRGYAPPPHLVHAGGAGCVRQTPARIKESVGGSMSTTRTIRIGLWAGGVVLSTSVAFAQNPPPSPQTPSSTAPTTTATDQATSTYGSPVTITGCVQQATGSGAGASNGGFVLRNGSGRGATSSGASSSAPSSTSPSSTPASSTMGREFQLMPGSSSVQLADHLGHQVEVTGTFGSPSASPMTPSTTTGATGSPSGTGTSGTTPGRPGSTQPGQATSPSASNMGTSTSFTVTSVRMLSATCPQ
jgi:hypothetical protein